MQDILADLITNLDLLIFVLVADSTDFEDDAPVDYD